MRQDVHPTFLLLHDIYLTILSFSICILHRIKIEKGENGYLSEVFMKTTMANLGIIVVTGFLLMSCATVQDTLYMQSLDVRGPVNLPPIHTNNDSIASRVSISPRVNVMNADPVQGNVESNMYASPGENLNWSFPVSTFGFDIDARVSPSVALSFGLNYATMGHDELVGGSAGLGFMFRGDNAMGRIEVGAQFQTMRYDASTVLVQTITPWYTSSSTTTIGYFHDIGTSTPFGYYGSLIVQSRKLSGIFDIFAQLAVSRQGLTSFSPQTEVAYLGVMTYISTDTRTGNSATLVTLTPGLSFNLGGSSRFLTAVRIIKEVEVSSSSEDFLFQPVVQFEIGL